MLDLSLLRWQMAKERNPLAFHSLNFLTYFHVQLSIFVKDSFEHRSNGRCIVLYVFLRANWINRTRLGNRLVPITPEVKRKSSCIHRVIHQWRPFFLFLCTLMWFFFFFCWFWYSSWNTILASEILSSLKSSCPLLNGPDTFSHGMYFAAN